MWIAFINRNGVSPTESTPFDDRCRKEHSGAHGLNGQFKCGLTVVGSCVTRAKCKERRISILNAGDTAGNKSKRVFRPEYMLQINFCIFICSGLFSSDLICIMKGEKNEYNR